MPASSQGMRTDLRRRTPAERRWSQGWAERPCRPGPLISLLAREEASEGNTGPKRWHVGLVCPLLARRVGGFLAERIHHLKRDQLNEQGAACQGGGSKK